MSVHEDSSGPYSQDEAMNLRKLRALSVFEGKTAQKGATDLAASFTATPTCSTVEQEQVQIDSEQTATPKFAAVAFASEAPAPALDLQLAALGVGYEQLSEAGKGQVEAIAGVSDCLGLTTTKQAAVLAAAIQLRKQQWAAEDAQAGAAALGNALKAQIEIVRGRIQQLKEISLVIEEKQATQALEVQEKQQHTQRLGFKTDNYLEELSQLEAKLKREGFAHELRHESLTERSAKLAARQAQIAALKEKLMFFRDLPPDIDAAHQLYNTKFSQMEAAAKQFEDGLAQL